MKLLVRIDTVLRSRRDKEPTQHKAASEPRAGSKVDGRSFHAVFRVPLGTTWRMKMSRSALGTTSINPPMARFVKAGGRRTGGFWAR